MNKKSVDLHPIIESDSDAFEDMDKYLEETKNIINY